MRRLAAGLFVMVLASGCMEVPTFDVSDARHDTASTGSDTEPADTEVIDSAPPPDTTTTDVAVDSGPKWCPRELITLVKGTIGPEGGAVQLVEGSDLPFSLRYAAGQLAATNAFKIAQVSLAAPTAGAAASPVYFVSPGPPTEVKATITIAVPAGATGPFAVYQAVHDGAPFELLPDATLEGDALKVVARPDGYFFSAATTKTPLASLCP